jgi:hypothetical protein
MNISYIGALNSYKNKTDSRKKTPRSRSKKGGSYASDNVTSLMDPLAYERMEFMLSGGKCTCTSPSKLKGGYAPSMTVPMGQNDATPSLPTNMLASFAQPLGPTNTMTNDMTFPSYMGNFFPLLNI